MAANEVRPFREQYLDKNQIAPQIQQKIPKQHKIDAKLADQLVSKISIYHGSITHLQNIDAVVNPTMSSLWTTGTGVSGIIFREAGFNNLQNACEAIINKADNNKISLGHTVITPGFALNAKYILHTVAPYMTNDNDNKSGTDYLISCYMTSLNLCVTNDIKTVAFPCIGTGDGNYNKSQSCSLALNAVKSWLCDANDTKYSQFIKNKKDESKLDIDDIFSDDTVFDKIDCIIFCCFDKQNWDVYKNNISKVYPSSDKQHSYLYDFDNDEKKQVNVVQNKDTINQKVKLFANIIQNNINGKWTEYDTKLKTMSAEIQKLSQLNKQKDEQIKSLNDKVTQLLEDKKENNAYNDNDIMTQMTKMTQRMDEMNAKIVALDKDNKTLSKQDKLKLFLEKSNVSKYYDLFIENGFESVESLFSLTTDDLKEIGISKLFDRKQILASIQTEKNINNQNTQANYEGNSNYM